MIFELRPKIDTGLLLVFVLVPPVFTAYSLLMGGQVGSDGFSFDANIIQLSLATLALGEIGCLAVAGWRKELRFTAATSVAVLIVMPILLGIVPGESKAATGYLLLALVVVVLSAGIEGLLRYEGVIETALRTNAGKYAVAIGAAHVLLAVGLQLLVRGTNGMYGFMMVYGSFSGLLLFSMTVVAALLWVRNGLRSPSVLLTGWFLAGAYGSITLWMSRGGVSRSAGVDWSRLSPAPDYLLSTGTLLAVFIFFVGAELAARCLSRSRSDRVRDSGLSREDFF